MIRLQRVLAISAAAMFSLSLTACGSDSGSADCAAPTIELGEASAEQQMVIKGKYYFDDCYDTGQQGTPPATQDIEISVDYDGSSTTVGTVDAEADGTFTATFDAPDLPADGPETGKIVAKSGQHEATIEFTVAK